MISRKRQIEKKRLSQIHFLQYMPIVSDSKKKFEKPKSMGCKHTKREYIHPSVVKKILCMKLYTSTLVFGNYTNYLIKEENNVCKIGKE